MKCIDLALNLTADKALFMQTLITSIDPTQDFSDALSEAVELLNAGEVVAVPTETVYGLAANALEAAAVRKIFAAKERPAFDPLIVHLADASELERVAQVPAEQRELIEALSKEFWPGPLTLVLPKQEIVPDEVTAGLPTVAVRVSADPVMQALLRRVGQPLAAPSANRFGRISPTSASAVAAELGGRIPLILDAGASQEGIESTIIAIEPAVRTKPVLRVLRPGPVTREMLRPFGKVETKPKRCPKNEEPAVVDGEPLAPAAPGLLASHYAPTKKFLLLEEGDTKFSAETGLKYGLISFRGQEGDGFIGLHDWSRIEVLSPGRGKGPEAAVRLYYVMREMDADEGIDVIVAEPVRTVGVGLAIMDRLRRAAGRGE